MIRKLLSVGLCSFGVLALLGASEAQAKEGNQYVPTDSLSTDSLPEYFSGESLPQISAGNINFATMSAGSAAQESAEEVVLEVLVEDLNHELLVDGYPVSNQVERQVVKGITYVSLVDMAKELDDSAVCTWNPDTKTVTIESEHISLKAVGGQYYLQANGRYLYIEETVTATANGLVVPLSVLTRAFGAELFWDPQLDLTTIVTGSGGIESGASFYDSDELFWMSRVVFAESGNQPVEGQMGVAMVVLNRVANSSYPNTILGVLSQRNQFSTYQNGGLANRTPNESSIIAAKLVLDGGVVKEIAAATHFDSISGSWASYNLKTIKVIGGHTFYG